MPRVRCRGWIFRFIARISPPPMESAFLSEGRAILPPAARFNNSLELRTERPVQFFLITRAETQRFRT
jgi:hypothetical protein